MFSRFFLNSPLRSLIYFYSLSISLSFCSICCLYLCSIPLFFYSFIIVIFYIYLYISFYLIFYLYHSILSSIYISIYLYIYLSIYLSIYLTNYLFTFHLTIYLSSIYRLFMSVSIYLFVCSKWIKGIWFDAVKCLVSFFFNLHVCRLSVCL